MKFWILSLAVALSVIQVSNGVRWKKKYDLRNPSPTGQDLGISGSYRKLSEDAPLPNEIPTHPMPRPHSPPGHRPHQHHHPSPGNDNNLDDFDPDDPRRNEVQPPQPKPRRNSGHGHGHHHHHHHHHHSHPNPNDIDNNLGDCDSNDPQHNEVEPPTVRPRRHSDGGKPPAPPKPPRRNRPKDGQRDRAGTV